MKPAMFRRRARPQAPPRAAPLARDASRRDSSGAAVAILLTLGISLAAYSISTKVGAERRELARLARANAALSEETAALEAELRVRMRLPQLQRWNDEVLRLQPVAASQLLKDPVDLALYAAPAPPPMAVAPLPVALPGPAGPAAAGRPPPGLTRAAAPPRPPVARAPSPPAPAAPAPTPPALAPAQPALILASVEAALDAPVDPPESEH